MNSFTVLNPTEVTALFLDRFTCRFDWNSEIDGWMMTLPEFTEDEQDEFDQICELGGKLMAKLPAIINAAF